MSFPKHSFNLKTLTRTSTRTFCTTNRLFSTTKLDPFTKPTLTTSNISLLENFHPTMTVSPSEKKSLSKSKLFNQSTSLSVKMYSPKTEIRLYHRALLHDPRINKVKKEATQESIALQQNECQFFLTTQRLVFRWLLFFLSTFHTSFSKKTL